MEYIELRIVFKMDPDANRNLEKKLKSNETKMNWIVLFFSLEMVSIKENFNLKNKKF